MSGQKAGKTSKEQARPRKYNICPKCKLRIRCGDIDRHQEGWHHRNKVV